MSLPWDDFRTLLARYLSIDVERIRPETDISSELGLDALDLVMLSVRVEEVAEVELPITAIALVTTVNELYHAFRPTKAPSSARSSDGPELHKRLESQSMLRSIQPKHHHRAS